MNYNSLKSDIAAVVRENGNQEITGENLQGVLTEMIDNSVGTGYLYKGIATPETQGGTPDQNVFYLAGAGTYTNFGSTKEIPEGSVGIIKYDGEWQLDLVEVVGSESMQVDCFPFANTESQSVFDKCIVDFNLYGSYDYDIGLYTLQNLGTQYQIRIAALNTDGTPDTSKGSNSIIATFVGNIGDGVEKIIANTVASDIIKAILIVDWSKFPSTTGNKASITHPRKFAPILNESVNLMNKRRYYNLTPVANEVVWDKRTFFPDYEWMKDFVVDIQLNSESPSASPICIGQIRVLNGGRTFITIHKCSDSGLAPNDNASQICLFDTNTWNVPSLDEGGHRYERLTLNAKNASGVNGYMVVDWAVLPIDYTTQTAYVLYRQFHVLNSLLSSKVYKGSSAISGQITKSFQIDGVDALLHTSSLYSADGTPDWLMIVSHGNGMGDNLSVAMPSIATGGLSWFDSHGISIAVIRTQDQEVAPYTTKATGWGNDVCVARTIKLYNYLMERYNFKQTVILAGESMGGCTMGVLAYKKPFPIAFCLGCGPVPGVKIMFQNSSSAYKASIRAAYGMAADGSNDADIESYVQGYDWYDMGLIDQKKFGFPNMYMYYGDDNTFRTNFGGVAKYTEIVNSLLASGSYSIMKQAGITDVDGHATDKCFSLAIQDGVFEKEIGIV